MTTSDRTILRAAVLIREQLAGRNLRDLSRCMPEYSWAAAVRLRRQIVQAQERGWHRAAGRLMEDLRSTIRRCQTDLEIALHTIESGVPASCTTSATEIFKDITALHEEFEEVEIGMAEHELCVTTDAIVLEGIDLGRFQIRLDWYRLGSSSAYRVVALDPNPAATNESVTHPHVQDETLCEGDGRAAIHAALAQGRFYDLFLLVSQLLHTYGVGSAYVELSAWDGISCDDCGTNMREEDRYGCSRCGSSLCAECSYCCAGCEESHCRECLTTCPECEQEFCRGCLITCPRCRRRICHSCQEGDLCTTCHQKQSEEERDDVEVDQGTVADDSTATGTEAVDAAAEPDRLGEALVPA